jgi:hypothetical protein
MRYARFSLRSLSPKNYAQRRAHLPHLLKCVVMTA